ncbi:MAG: hypothetical protein FD180_231 [Planctomycetota bacterium]|nr:MAG: hypothetical protein FD180_231 [Planctomycetota bacterium]
MRFAREAHTGREVDAEAETAFRSFTYQCPVCGGTVHPRKGAIRVHYFAHNPNQGSPACELYHPGSHSTVSRPSVRSGPHSFRPPLSLYVGLREWKQGRGAWNLQLQVPQMGLGPGFVIVDAALRGRVTIPVSRLSKGAIRVDVCPQTDAYKLSTVGTSGSAGDLLLAEPTLGLSSAVPTVFRFSDNGGRRLANPDQPLFWGRGYVLLFHRSSQLRNVPARTWALREQGDWAGMIVQLPTEESEILLSWVRGTLRRSIESPPVRLQLVAPTVTRVFEDDSIGIPPGRAVILSVSGEPGCRPPATLCVGTLSGTTTIDLPSQLPAFIGLGGLSEAAIEAYLPNEWDAEIRLVRTPSEARAEPAGAELDVESEGRRIRVPFHACNANETLREVSGSRFTLKGVRLPKRLKVRLMDCSGDQGRIEETSLLPDFASEELDDAKRHFQFEQRVFKLLLERLVRDGTGIQVDLGNFGRAGTIQDPPPQGGQRILLSSTARRTARWIVSTAKTARGIGGSVHCSDGIRKLSRLLESEGLRLLDEEDRRLLIEITRGQSFPPELDPHLRALSRDVMHAFPAAGFQSARSV